jgi:uncharacterized protein (DUF1499 family)
MKWLKRVFWALLILTAAGIGAGQAGLLKGSPPTDLGVRDGKLKVPSTRPNSVSSQAGLWPDEPQARNAQIAPLALKGGDGPATMAALLQVVRTAPGAVVITADPDYIYAQFTTPLMKYTDDVEFWLDPAAAVVQVRSASRLGESDLGTNRQRIEAIRAHLAARP